MIIDTDKMIPITKLQKSLPQKVREISETGEPLYILKNNELTAVIVSKDEYETLKQAEEILEHFEIADMIKKRLKSYEESEIISWTKVKAKHGL